MGRRMRLITWALAALIGATAPASLLAHEADGTTGHLSSEDLERLTQTWVEELWAHYATGESGLPDLTTPTALEGLQAEDWRYSAVTNGSRYFQEDVAIVPDGIHIDEPESEDGEVLVRPVEVLVEVAPFARAIDQATGRTVEVESGAQRRAMRLEFRREPGTDAWSVADVGVPRRLRDPDLGWVEPTDPNPCPGFGSDADPFLAKPWCTAGGDGRKLVPGYRGPSEIELTKGEPGSCFTGTYTLLLGSPPGSPVGRYDGYVYARDPNAAPADMVVAGPRYRRDAALPADAISTGITNGRVTLWTSATVGDKAIYVQIGNRFERWPLVDFGCA